MQTSTGIVSLTPSPPAALAVAQAAATVTADPYRDGGRFAEQARAAADRLPAQLAESLDAVATHSGPVAIHITGLPALPPIPATPTAKFDAIASVEPIGSEPVLGVLGAAVGEIFGYREWDSGHVVQNRYPVAAHRDIQAASGSSELVMHTESSFADVTPDHLLLLGLRTGQVGEVSTTVADIGQALDVLPEPTRGVLRSAAFVFETDMGDYLLDGRRTTAPQPILTDTEVHYSTPLTGIDPAARQALRTFAKALADQAQQIVLGPGEALLIDNRRAVHGRSGFAPRFDGTDRWIQRVLLRRELPPSGHVVTDSRMAHYPTDYRATLALPA